MTFRRPSGIPPTSQASQATAGSGSSPRGLGPSLLRPAPLGPGSRVRVVASSGPFERDAFLAGLALLESRYQVEVDSRLLDRREGFLAGSDAERLEELERALSEPGLDAIWLARGGYGLGRLVAKLDLGRARERPRWFVGFSDATTLHLALQTAGVVSLHAANVTGLGRLGREDLEATFRCLEVPDGDNELPVRPQNEAARELLERAEEQAEPPEERTERGGPRRTATALLAPLWGGNLTVLFAEAAAGRLRIPTGATLLLEDVSETSYRVDRMLTALLDGGHFDSLGALVLGDFHECSAGKFGVAVEAVLEERLMGLSVPVFGGAPVGHGLRNLPMLLGQTLRVAASG